MSKRSILLAISMVGVFSIFVSNLALARGILGFQLGDRSPEDNDRWLKMGVEQIHMAIKAANDGNGEKSVEHGKAGFAAIKEINSEGWDDQKDRSVRSLRLGISAAKKGELEKASLEFQDALKKLGDLKHGDMNWTHDSFFGIGDHK